MKEKTSQQKVILFQLLQKHMQSLKERSSLLEKRMIENATTKQLVNDLEKKSKNDLLIPMGSGLFFQGKSRKGKLLSNIGAGVIVSKDTDDAKKLLKNNREQIENAQEQLQEEFKKVSAQLNSIGSELQAEIGKK